MYGRNLKAYKKTNIEAELAIADPHRIIQMLYEGLLERLSQAKGAILRNDFSYKADRIAKAQGIIYGLENSLNRNADPALYDRMLSLYEYMRDRLTTASLSLETAPIDECINLLIPIKQAWDKIPNDVKQEVNEKLVNK